MRKSIQKGFTLIELMIVIAIIGILAAIAIPAYQDYTIRSQASEGLTLASSVQVAIADYYAQNGTWPTGITGGGTALNFTNAPSGNYVGSVATAGGAINVTYGNKANAALTGKVLSLVAYTSSAGDIGWACGLNTTLPPAAVSSGGANGTNVAAKYLPKNCQN
jgi:type IV pilus assembly protein PilA